MEQQAKNELIEIRRDIAALSDRFEGRFGTIDQRFVTFDQRFDGIDQRITSEFRVLHASINKLAIDAQKQRTIDEQFQNYVRGMFETMVAELRDAKKVPALEKQVANHDMRISNLESAVRKSK